MTTNDDLHEELVGIRTRLDLIEGRVLLTARAQKQLHLDELREEVEAQPLIAKCYLALSSPMSQRDLAAAVSVHEGTVSKLIPKLYRGLGIIQPARGSGPGNHWSRTPDYEYVLNLEYHMTEWLK